MWFKNLQIYRFSQSYDLTPEVLGEQIESCTFVPCGGQDVSRSGFVAPLGRHGAELVHATNGYMMICQKRQDKLLPAAVINEQLEEKVVDIETREARQVSRKERRSLRDEIQISLLPRAFVRSQLMFAFVSPRDRLLVVDASSATRAELLLADLREALGTLSVVPLTTKHSPTGAMTEWINRGTAPNGFELGGECELHDDTDAGSIIRCKNQDLTASEIGNHIQSGMHVKKLAINWQQRLECVLDDKLVVRRLRFTDIVQEQSETADTDDAATRFDSDFAIMSLEISAFVKSLVEAFGGIDSDSDLENK